MFRRDFNRQQWRIFGLKREQTNATGREPVGSRPFKGLPASGRRGMVYAFMSLLPRGELTSVTN
jgi:hypothetical protein